MRTAGAGDGTDRGRRSPVPAPASQPAARPTLATAARPARLARPALPLPLVAAAALTAVLALASGLVGVVGAQPASAHDALVSTDPANGSTVATAPDQVTLTFTEKVLALGTEVKVTAPDGSAAASGPVQVSGTAVVQPLAAARPAGTYTVDWRVTSADGHPVSGAFTFTASAAVGTPTPTATPSATPTPTPTATPTTTSTAGAATASATPSPTATPAGATAGGRTFWPFLAAVLIVAAGAAAIGRRRARGPKGDPR